MASAQTDSASKPRQAQFQISYIWVALAAAIFGGFALAAHLSFVIGYNFPLGTGFATYIQLHGHIQLIGWAGLFIVGISLHFIPRLAGAPVAGPEWIARLPWLIGGGILLRFVCHPLLPYFSAGATFTTLSWLVVASGAVQWYGILIYATLLIATVVGMPKRSRRSPLIAVRPFFGMMIAGFLVYTSLNLIGLIQMALSGGVAIDQGLNEVAIQVFIDLTLLPVAFAFSIRMFPLYLRLPAATWPVRRIAYLYLLSFCLSRVSILPIDLGQIVVYVANAGVLLRGGVILWMVWKLDILTRMRKPWTAHRTLQPAPDRRPTRPKIPDYGEFGRFERLIYAAYTWLVLGAFLEMLISGVALFGHTILISIDVPRHTYMLGFITNLILGMSVRMIPGFMKKRRLASTKLVDATFWLMNIATVGRLLPLILPSAVFEVNSAAVASESAFALSGALGLSAVICLAVNLWATVRTQKAAR